MLLTRRMTQTDSSKDARIWLRGDWHIHSRHSTDSSHHSIGTILEKARSLGLDYLAITDHDVHVQGAVADHTWADPEFAAAPLPLFHGAELTAPRGHINIYGLEAYDHQRIFDARNARDWNLLALTRELGVHVSANHLVTKNHYGFSFDIAHSVEIWNGAVWPRNIPGLRVWDDQLLSGRILPARGGSDAHHGFPPDGEPNAERSLEAMTNAVGTPTTWVLAEGRDKPAILAALEAGRATVSANPNAPRAELEAGTGSDRLIMGQNAPVPTGPVRFTLRLSEGRLPGVRYRVRVVRNRNEHDLIWTDPETGVASFTDTPEGQTYYRAEVEGPQTPCPEVPLSMTASGHMVALTNPIYFGYDPAF